MTLEPIPDPRGQSRGAVIGKGARCRRDRPGFAVSKTVHGESVPMRLLWALASVAGNAEGANHGDAPLRRRHGLG